MHQDNNIDKDLEFNNGVGDALREKDQYTFSWKKTTVVLSVGLAFVILITFGLMELGKGAVNRPLVNSNQPVINLAVIDDPLLNDTWDVLPEDQPNTALFKKESKKDLPAASSSAPRLSSAKSKEDKVSSSPTIQPSPSGATEKKAPTNKSNVYRVIAGTFSSYKNATLALERIREKGFDGYIWSLESKDKKTTYKLQVAAFKSLKSAKLLKKDLNNKNIEAFISTK